MRVAIIGGGSVGLACASTLSKNKDIEIDIYERSSKLGRKILASGNGRCNISNINVFNKESYNNELAYKIILSNEEYERWFLERKLSFSSPDEDGRIYPYSYHSSSVLKCLLDSLSSNTHVIYDTEVKKIEKKNDKYEINKKIYDYVVIGIGSSANEKKNVYLPLISSLSHSYTSFNPSIHYLCVKEDLKEIENVRAKVAISLFVNNNKYTRRGEILFKDKYISGICVFELSTILSRLKQNNINIDNAYFEIDFIDGINDIKDIESYFHPSLSSYLLKHIKDKEDIKHFRLSFIDQFNDNYYAQVMCGGVNINEINDNLESKYNKNLYFGGEILDIDGICGGYNLHFAISSGIRIGLDILRKENK